MTDAPGRPVVGDPFGLEGLERGDGVCRIARLEALVQRLLDVGPEPTTWPAWLIGRTEAVVAWLIRLDVAMHVDRGEPLGTDGDVVRWYDAIAAMVRRLLALWGQSCDGARRGLSEGSARHGAWAVACAALGLGLEVPDLGTRFAHSAPPSNRARWRVWERVGRLRVLSRLSDEHVRQGWAASAVFGAEARRRVDTDRARRQGLLLTGHWGTTTTLRPTYAPVLAVRRLRLKTQNPMRKRRACRSWAPRGPSARNESTDETLDKSRGTPPAFR
jgi:hypothetical protein